MPELQMSNVPVDALEPNPWNTNRITDPANEERLRESLRRFGVFKPIIARELPSGQLQILGGEHRWRAARQMGMTEVPVVNLGNIDDRRAKEIGLVDNGRYGDDDIGELSKLLGELGKDVLTFMPYTDADIQAMLDSAPDFDLDDLDSIADGPKSPLDELPKTPTSQMMRFKVPIQDSVWLTAMIEAEMKSGGFKDEDALSNAGHALVSLLNRLRKS
jgi:hypothetical protein